MKKLYDETFDYGTSDRRRTIWYADEAGEGSVFEPLFGEPDEYGGRKMVSNEGEALIAAVKDIMIADLQEPQEATETHWILYSNVINGDAVGDKVRFAIYLRLKDGELLCNFNLSDFIFASSYDNVLKLKERIERSSL